IDGFDPGGTRDIPAIYATLNYGTGQNLADDLRNLGFDIVIVDFPNYVRTGTSTDVAGGADYIQRNAMTLIEIINQINSVKVGTEKNVLIGPSVGGLVGRYAMRYMEMNSLNHDTRLYISFDTPHQGANIPIGFQHLFNYMAYGPVANPTVQALVDSLLKGELSREILIDQFEGHLQSGNAVEFDPAILLPTGKPGFRDAFQAELDAMGLPQNSRNVAIANGSSNGSMNGTPDMVVMDHTFNLSATERAIINLRFTPLANQTNQVSRFRGQANVFGFWVTVYESMANSMSPSYTDGLDTAPGSRFDMTALAPLSGGDPMLSEFFDNLTIDYFTFVPTNSALMISGTQDWYEPVTASSVTAFDAIQVPTENENHVTLTTANLAFVLDEILNPPLAVAENNFDGLQVQNPVGTSINLYSTKALTNASVNLTDITGKSIFELTGQNIQGSFQIPVSLTQGIYFMTIHTSEGNITKKLVKN
ncbi:MAG TPA: T9SS type A sorting domain-containing protein, partial [Flavobacterium sp.]